MIHNRLLEKELLHISNLSHKKAFESPLTKKKQKEFQNEAKTTPYKARISQVLKFRSPLQVKSKTPPIKVSPFGLQETEEVPFKQSKRTITTKPIKTLDAP